MGTTSRIPVHRLEEKFSDIYLVPLTPEQAASPPYEAAQPHRHDFYYCVLLEQGSLALEVDFQPIQLLAHSLFLSYPGQVHRLVSTRWERGWFLAFAPTVLDEPLRDILDQCLPEVMLLPLAPAQLGGLGALLQQLLPVYEDKAHALRQPLMQALVRAVVYQVAAAYLAQEKVTLGRQSARQIELTKAFKRLLRQHYGTLKKPAEFAARLHVSVSYLNDTVRAVTGFSVTHAIQQALMREAQRLLQQAELSVNEVAYQLGFEDAKYFNRLFRQVVGVAPGAFRKQG